MLALQLDDRTESKGIIVLDILTFIKYDVFECVGAENINVIPHHAIRRKDQVKMTEEFFRLFLVYSHGVVVFRHRECCKAFGFPSPVMK